jgi:hypothetical protein
VKWSKKNTLSFSGDIVVSQRLSSSSFLLLSLTHAPIIGRSMLRILWMQRNTWLIILVTLKMIAMSSARSASILSMVKSKETTGTAATLIPPLASPPPKPPLILLMSKQHRCLHIKHQVGITLRVQSPTIEAKMCEKRPISGKLLCLLHNLRRKLLWALYFVIHEPKCYTL